MRITIFDVSNGNCALAVCVNGYSVMFDCGSNIERECPIDAIKRLRFEDGWLSHMNDFEPGIVSYPLTKLVVSHPDFDHIKNIQKVHKEFTPYLLKRRHLEEFPHEVFEQDYESYRYYKNNVCSKYRSTPVELPPIAFSEKYYKLDMSILKNDPLFIDGKMKNNSSIVSLLEYRGFRILFCGDMEKIGWDWLIDNDPNFVSDISDGIDVLVASHHGHVSGYSQRLVDLMGTPQLVVLSKGSESGGETDVDGRYSSQSSGLLVTGVTKKNSVVKKTLTTRSNGNIYIDVDAQGDVVVLADSVCN